MDTAKRLAGGKEKLYKNNIQRSYEYFIFNSMIADVSIYTFTSSRFRHENLLINTQSFWLSNPPQFLSSSPSHDESHDHFTAHWAMQIESSTLSIDRLILLTR